jgi:hypothetical protein
VEIDGLDPFSNRVATRSWPLAIVVAVASAVPLGAGGLVAILGSEGEFALVYALVAILVLTALVVRAAPKGSRDSLFWLKIGALVFLGVLTAWGTTFLCFVLLWSWG